MPVLIIQGKGEPILEGETVEDAVRRLGLHPDAFLYVMAGRPVPMDTVPEEDVKLLKVASGG